MYEIFAKLLEERGVTPYQVFKATGVAQSSLSDWKNNKSKPKYEKMKLIAEFFDVSVDYLISGVAPEQKKLPSEEDNAGFFRVMQTCREKGYTPEDIELAMDFFDRAQKRDQERARGK